MNGFVNDSFAPKDRRHWEARKADDRDHHDGVIHREAELTVRWRTVLHLVVVRRFSPRER
jgi:hypothetical protein